MAKELTIPEYHQLRIAKQTMKLSKIGALILGGMNHAQAKIVIEKLGGKGNGKREI